MRLLRLFFTCLFALGLSLPVAAQQRSADEIDKLRMDIAGRQRLLSQRMTAAACFLTLGIDRERQIQILTQSLDLFRVSLDHLETGAPSMGLPPIDGVFARIALHESRMIWGPYRNLATQIRDQRSADKTDAQTLLGRLVRLEPILLATSQSVVGALERAKAPQSGAHLVEIKLAGRQRMLSQAIIKDICLLAATHGANGSAEAHISQIRTKTDLFEKTGYALRRGIATDTPDPPAPDTFEALVQAHYAWSDLIYLLEPAAADTSLSNTALFDVAHLYEDLLPRLEEVVWAYVNG
ncbi:type IV pili methyl-accepting chemotaxis transducer N-terminal domain-containing protein [Thioclava sp. 15-R06ZXC-3]|uniref:Type IV pili methyl-accepting chemotaxis transducer N-terminal domain-containing protein n=1 Tax=Thioclava arctica TaxID=3238301 RepID=A0ABV3TMW2_9RHOB